jgi:hypothetical protein
VRHGDSRRDVSEEDAMLPFFTPSATERRALEDVAAQIPEVQRRLTANHPRLTLADRGAHQQQLAGSRVHLTLAPNLPRELDGLGIFRPPANGIHHIGIGRISTGLGCPHAETDADFLGLMTAFRAPNGKRIDFITINDPTSPTDTSREFLALLQATADAAGRSGQLASQATLLASLARHAGLRAPAIALHVTQQTSRTVRSRSAYQQYWTGIVRARETLGKFTFVPAETIPDGHPPGRSDRYFTEEWAARQSAGSIEFALYWIPFVDDRETPLENLTAPWRETHRVRVGTIVFPKIDPSQEDTQLVALLATEMGANQGNWEETSDGASSDLPATAFTAARQLAYRASQQTRQALADSDYESFFDRGEISAALAAELRRRRDAKIAAGHWVPK